MTQVRQIYIVIDEPEREGDANHKAEIGEELKTS